MQASRMYVPEGWKPDRQDCRQALAICQWIRTRSGLDEEPGEKELFVAMHTCAYRAGVRTRGSAGSEQERSEWRERWQQIRGHIVQRNLGLVYTLIGRLGSGVLDEDDRQSDAMYALTRAVDRFNPWKGYKFSTYACNVIARFVMRHNKKESRYRRTFPVNNDVSMERPVRQTESGTALYVERLQRVLQHNTGALSELEYRILDHRFPPAVEQRLTFSEIGRVVGLSKERVRQIQNTALLKLRRALSEDQVLQHA